MVVREFSQLDSFMNLPVESSRGEYDSFGTCDSERVDDGYEKTSVGKSSKLCTFWMQGKCERGETCRFLHSNTSRSQNLAEQNPYEIPRFSTQSLTPFHFNQPPHFIPPPHLSMPIIPAASISNAGFGITASGVAGYKQDLCSFRNGGCPFGKLCHNAHSLQELLPGKFTLEEINQFIAVSSGSSSRLVGSDSLHNGYGKDSFWYSKTNNSEKKQKRVCLNSHESYRPSRRTKRAISESCNDNGEVFGRGTESRKREKEKPNISHESFLEKSKCSTRSPSENSYDKHSIDYSIDFRENNEKKYERYTAVRKNVPSIERTADICFHSVSSSSKYGDNRVSSVPPWARSSIKKNIDLGSKNETNLSFERRSRVEPKRSFSTHDDTHQEFYKKKNPVSEPEIRNRITGRNDNEFLKQQCINEKKNSSLDQFDNYSRRDLPSRARTGDCSNPDYRRDAVYADCQNKVNQLARYKNELLNENQKLRRFVAAHKITPSPERIKPFTSLPHSDTYARSRANIGY